MEGLEELHNNVFFYLAIIMFSVSWIIVSIIINFARSYISNKYINHGTLVELIWTITPALILILIAFPSFKLLYLMDEVIDPSLVIYGEGHQWYWNYQYPDFTNTEQDTIELDSCIIVLSQPCFPVNDRASVFKHQLVFKYRRGISCRRFYLLIADHLVGVQFLLIPGNNVNYYDSNTIFYFKKLGRYVKNVFNKFPFKK